APARHALRNGYPGFDRLVVDDLVPFDFHRVVEADLRVLAEPMSLDGHLDTLPAFLDLVRLDVTDARRVLVVHRAARPPELAERRHEPAAIAVVDLHHALVVDLDVGEPDPGLGRAGRAFRRIRAVALGPLGGRGLVVVLGRALPHHPDLVPVAPARVLAGR